MAFEYPTFDSSAFPELSWREKDEDYYGFGERITFRIQQLEKPNGSVLSLQLLTANGWQEILQKPCIKAGCLPPQHLNPTEILALKGTLQKHAEFLADNKAVISRRGDLF